jgi:hypothetical protein
MGPDVAEGSDPVVQRRASRTGFDSSWNHQDFFQSCAGLTARFERHAPACTTSGSSKFLLKSGARISDGSGMRFLRVLQKKFAPKIQHVTMDKNDRVGMTGSIAG